MHFHSLHGLNSCTSQELKIATMSEEDQTDIGLDYQQTLMRALKSTGGLTRGRGMTEVQRLLWLLSRTTCTEVNAAMQNLTDLSFSTSHQHM